VRTVKFTGTDATQAAGYSVSTVTTGLATPYGVAVDPNGLIYVTLAGLNQVGVLNTSGGGVAGLVIAGTGTAGGVNGPGNVATFVSPTGLAWTPVGLVVSEPGLNRLRLLQLATGAGAADPSQWNVAELAGPPAGAPGFVDGAGNVAQFTTPAGLGASASGGGVYVADYGNNAVRLVALPTTSINSGATGGAGSSDVPMLSNGTGVVPSAGLGANLPYISYAGSLAAGASTAAQPWSFVVPSGVTAFSFTVLVEAGSSVLASPQSAIGGGSPNVQVRTLAGSSSFPGFVNGSPTQAHFNGPEIIAMDMAGNLFLADFYNSAVRRISTSGLTSTLAGALGEGFADGLGTVAQFSSPNGIAVTPDGTVCYVTDGGNQRLRRLALSSPGADPTNPANWSVTTIAGTGTAGGNYITPTPGNTATFNYPAGLVMDSAGNLIMSEHQGNRIRRVSYQGGDPSNAANWQVTLLAGNSGSVTPTGGDVDSANGSLATFSNPLGLAMDPASRVYVADAQNHRVRVVNSNGSVSTLAGGVSGDMPSGGYVDAAGASARFESPVGVAVDSAGFVYVAETNGNRIRLISPAGNVSTIAGSPTSPFGATGYVDGPGNVALFNNPYAVAVDPSGTLYVGETNNNVVRVIQRVISAGTN
jgi:sugar lactone lactonase YvrE